MTEPAIPVLLTRRLELRRVTEADIADYRRHFVDYEVIRHLAHVVPWPYPEDGVAVFVRETLALCDGKASWNWGLHLRDGDEMIGVINLWRNGKPEHRGFWLGRAFWGQGYMTEAVAAVNDFAFDTAGFEELVFANALGNERSRNVKLRTGATLIGVEPAKFVDPAYAHHEIWKLTRAEWHARRV
jgi:RimJ/RimL family protein N-acetyltransferase